MVFTVTKFTWVGKEFLSESQAWIMGSNVHNGNLKYFYTIIPGQ